MKGDEAGKIDHSPLDWPFSASFPLSMIMTRNSSCRHPPLLRNSQKPGDLQSPFEMQQDRRFRCCMAMRQPGCSRVPVSMPRWIPSVAGQ
jgi:hypothetical protein